MTTIDIDESIYNYDLDCIEKCSCGWVELDTGGWVRCKCYLRKVREKRVKKFIEAYPMPQLLRQKSFENFVCTSETQKMARERMQRCEPCYLFGPYGVGKTHLLAAMINLKLSKMVPAMFVSAPWLFEGLRRDMFRDGNTEHLVIDDACTVDFLAIDDLGKEKPTAMVEEKLFMIIDCRLSKGLPTSFSSNLPLDEQSNRIDGAIKSRMHEMCEVICVRGKDYRKDSN